MTMTNDVLRGWRMTGPGRMEWFEEPLPAPKPGWVTVEVLGCGVCHTDIGFLYEGVGTTAKLPLVLGHEIVGRVLGENRIVIVPAVSPCGECAGCRRGRRTACSSSLMPGNDHNGGFASHIQVPERWLCDVPSPPGPSEVWRLAAIGDAITTPYQAIRRAGLAQGEIAVVVGVGGVGGFLVELAAAVGALPIALDVSAERLGRAASRGAIATLEVGTLDARAARKELSHRLKNRGLDAEGWRVFECSGNPRGQALAFGLLTRGATLSVVGYTTETIPLRLSNLMAFDAEAYGNWGCDPALYPEVLRLVHAGKIDLEGALERYPLADAPQVLERVHRRELSRRPVLVPEASHG